jgi:hypothetical protein
MEPERGTPQHAGADGVSSSGPWIYLSVCQGMPPMVVELSSCFFGAQLVAGLASLFALVLIEVLR